MGGGGGGEGRRKRCRVQEMQLKGRRRKNKKDEIRYENVYNESHVNAIDRIRCEQKRSGSVSPRRLVHGLFLSHRPGGAARQACRIVRQAPLRSHDRARRRRFMELGALGPDARPRPRRSRAGCEPRRGGPPAASSAARRAPAEQRLRSRRPGSPLPRAPRAALEAPRGLQCRHSKRIGRESRRSGSEPGRRSPVGERAPPAPRAGGARSPGLRTAPPAAGSSDRRRDRPSSRPRPSRWCRPTPPRWIVGGARAARSAAPSGLPGPRRPRGPRRQRLQQPPEGTARRPKSRAPRARRGTVAGSGRGTAQSAPRRDAAPRPRDREPRRAATLCREARMKARERDSCRRRPRGREPSPGEPAAPQAETEATATANATAKVAQPMDNVCRSEAREKRP